MFANIFQAVGLWIMLCAPVALVWGWLRWWKQVKTMNLFSIASLAGFALATASALLAVSTAAYAKAIGGMLFFNLALSRIYLTGLLFSLSGLVFGIVGLWKTNPLRWHAPFCAAGTLIFWYMTLSVE
jgi:hypothetical protein